MGVCAFGGRTHPALSCIRRIISNLHRTGLDSDRGDNAGFAHGKPEQGRGAGLTGLTMQTILRTPVTHPSAWRGCDLAQDPSWVVRLSLAQAAELERAAGKALASGKGVTELARRDFPLEACEPVFEDVRRRVVDGQGFVLLRGLPVQGRSRDAIRAMYWALGTRLGHAVTQNLQGDLLAEIKDRGLDINNLDVKPSQTNAEQRPHTDPADVVGLLCINAAQSGGLSRIASTMAIYNAVLENHPEYLEWLYRGFHHNLRGDASEAAPFGCTPKPIPVYRYYQGALSCVFNASTIKEAQRRMGALVPEAEMRAIDYMVDLARSDEYRLDMEFEPGDLQVLNNYTVMHWRTGFTDWPEPARKRLLYRLWLKADGLRPVDPEMADGYITGSQAGKSVAGAYA